MTFGKRQLVAGALVLALGAAVYLNWQFSENEVLTVSDTSTTEDTTRQLGQATYVNTSVSDTSDESSETSDEESEAEESEAEETAADTSESDEETAEEESDFFEEERESRSQAREEALELLEEILESAESDEAAKTEAVSAAEELAAVIKTESDIETLIKAKGFDDCFVSINNGECSVIVSSGNLNDNTVLAIKDIVNTQGGIDFDCITVSEL